LQENQLVAEPIFLIGMMGSGKTTIGRRLAREIGVSFLDLDREIERRNGVTISTIFEIEGEGGFRSRETQLLYELAQHKGQVMATGGGVVLNPLNRMRLMVSGCVIYLYATPGLLYSRTRHDKSRPLIQVPDPLNRITQLVVRRDPLYREVADAVIEAGNDMSDIVDQIKDLIDRKCKH
jgi:shikimate kinase